MSDGDPPTPDEVFSAFKRGAVRKGYIHQDHDTGKIVKPPRYALTVPGRGPRYEEYLKYRQEFRHKGKKVSNARKYQIGISMRTRIQNEKQKKDQNEKNRVKSMGEELKELRIKCKEQETEIKELRVKYKTK